MKKRILSIVLVLVMALCITAVAPITAGAAQADVAESSNTSGDYYYEVLDDGTAQITWYTGSATELTIPSELDGHSVTSIGEWAFSSCENLKSITIPDSVTSIGDGAFSSCEDLKSITIPNSVTSIGDEAFGGCRSLESITIPNSVKSIGDEAFSYCANLKSITIPDSVTSIGGGAFSGCTSLKSITIPDSVTSIGGGYSFSGCTSLTSVTIGNSVTNIGEYAFYDCTSLESITIGNSVTNLDKSSFFCCNSLENINVSADNPNYCSDNGILFNKDKTEIIKYPNAKNGAYTIPDSVKTIGGWSFRECCNLTDIVIPNSVTSIEHYAFYDCTSLPSITIPNSVSNISNLCGIGLTFHKGYDDKIDGFIIKGYAGSTAEKYAKDNGFEFIDLDTHPDDQKNIIGDVDGDGTITIVDATTIQRHLAKIITLTDEQLSISDTDADGKVTIVDATMIQRYLAKLIDKLG